MARNYGTGSMKERALGVWRLRFMRNGRQVEGDVPGHENGRDRATTQRPVRLHPA
jgi:hypothetical protein